MKKIFLKNDICKKGMKISIEKEDFHHLVRVFRINKNDSLIIGDKLNKEFTCKINNITKDILELEIVDEYNRNIKNVPEIICFFSILKGEKNDLIIEKCTEIGISKFIPVITQNTVIKMDDKNKEKKLLRFKKIAKQASMQCFSYKIPEIFKIIGFDEIEKYDIKGLKIFGNLDEKNIKLIDILNRNNNTNSVSFFVGPEGDFSIAEKKKLIELGWKGINLSDYILKGETAAVLFSSVIYSYFYRGF